jgi:hypothetical protein
MRVESTKTIGPIRGTNGTDHGRSDRRLSALLAFHLGHVVEVEPIDSQRLVIRKATRPRTADRSHVSLNEPQAEQRRTMF